MGDGLAETRAAVLASGPSALAIDDLAESDLDLLGWSGSATHLRSVADYLARVPSGEVEYLVVRGSDGTPVAKGGIDYVEAPDIGTILQLATHSELQGLGLGSALITAAEERIRRRGIRIARLGVEDDNPKARALYERLGYRPVGKRASSWEAERPDGSLYLYTTTITELDKDLTEDPASATVVPGPMEIPYRRDPSEYVFMAELDRHVLAPARYARGPDSESHPEVPVGQLIEHTWDQSRIFPGTARRYWVYVPAQYRAEEVANLLVVQDGWYYLDLNNQIRTAVVLDNLIHQGEIPVTIGVFVDPGEFPSEEDPVARRNRNLEYDTYSDAYARFLLEEILPPVLRDYRIAEDPARWAIAGGSSGGDCSFTVAWMRPDRFRKVLIFESSWPQVRGADYERLILETPPKPLRVFMHAASRDIRWGRAENNWFSSNLRVAAALAERGYDLRFVLGDGPHDPNHAGVVLPDALRWLWHE